MLTRVIVIGAGFAGIQLIRNLDPGSFEVWLFDRLNHHQFQPLFYQVATSQVEPASITFPLRKLFRNRKNTHIRMAEVLSVNPGQKCIQTSIGRFAYDLKSVIAGEGRTDVELAGSFAEIKKNISYRSRVTLHGLPGCSCT